ncbi:hypothetical protein BDV97DRAFT_344491 [Delphinella strobiligena]|nr:hypothetical protein BDV97DRAFT_344491 [Delphinella strobiligena]
MAFLSHQMTFPVRSLNKEPDWNIAYDDLFNQYIDTEHLEYSDSAEPFKEQSNSDNSGKFVHSEESTTSSARPGSSPPYKWHPNEAEQDFWAKTLRSLEESASSCSVEQGRQVKHSKSQRNLTVTPHHDFLSLGGCPSPHITVPSSPFKSAKRAKSLGNLRQPKPTVVPKSPGIKKTWYPRTKSPKMMSPSRYRAGFKDAWADKTGGTPRTYTMALPLRSAHTPLSPPPSAKASQAVDSAAFCSPHEIDFNYQCPYPEDELSPRSNKFQHQIRAQTPSASPLTSPGVERAKLCEDPFTSGSMYYAVPPTAPQSTRSSWLRLEPEEDDYEVSPAFNPWLGEDMITSTATTTTDQHVRTGLDLFDDVNISPYTDFPSSALGQGGLMISCDPTLTTSGFPHDSPDAQLSALPTDTYNYAIPTQKEQHEKLLSRTPSPPPDVGAPRSGGRTGSKCRSKRTPSTPRSPRGVGKSAFVNFTPHDSAKLLTGVAPSGSSKTKARREQEAAEKRRKFSQAAVKAVEIAGGDVTRLRDVIFKID